MNAASRRAGPAADELQLLVLRAANAASRLEPESLPAIRIAEAAGALREPLETLGHALDSNPLGGVGAMARWELARLAEELDALASGPVEEAAAALVRLGSARQSALGALLGLDRMLADLGLVPLLDGIALHECRRALAVRAAFVAFRNEVRSLGEPERGPAREQLLRIATLLEELLAGRGRRQLRVADRVQVESLLARIAATVDTAGEAAAVWRDIAAFAEMALSVNRRAELREHDANLAGRLARELETRPASFAEVGFRRRLARLHGRDEALDRLIEAGDGTAAVMVARLEAIVAGRLG